MAVAAPVIVGVPMAAMLGFFFGMGPCIVSCFPYLGPVFLGSDGGVRQSWRILLPLSLGRLTGYIGLGLASGLAGQLVVEQVESSAIRLVLGAATLLVGLALLWRSRSAPRCASPSASSEAVLRPMAQPRVLMPGGLYLMGAGMALNPCAPLGVVMASASASAPSPCPRWCTAWASPTSARNCAASSAPGCRASNA
jgi:thiol:disulfide interchange protein DsbD